MRRPTPPRTRCIAGSPARRLRTAATAHDASRSRPPTTSQPHHLTAATPDAGLTRAAASPATRSPDTPKPPDGHGPPAPHTPPEADDDRSVQSGELQFEALVG